MDGYSKDALLEGAMKAFIAKLNDRIMLKVRGMEEELRGSEYQQLIQLEIKCINMETSASQMVLQAKKSYLRALAEISRQQHCFFKAIQESVTLLDQRNEIAKDANKKLSSGDYGFLTISSSSIDVKPSPALIKMEKIDLPCSSILDHPVKEEPMNEELFPPISKSLPANELQKMKERLKNMNISPHSTSRSILKPLQQYDMVDDAFTPRPRPGGVLLSSQGSLDGSVVPNTRVTPIKVHSKVPQPNFDETLEEPEMEFKIRLCMSGMKKKVKAESSCETPVQNSTYKRPELPPLSTTRPSPRPMTSSTVLGTGLASLPPRPVLKSDLAKAFLDRR